MRNSPCAGLLAALALIVSSTAGSPAFAAGPTGPPPGGARELQPGQLPRQCAEGDNATNAYGPNFGYYWSENGNRWVQAPFCYPRWGWLQASASQIIAPGATVTVTGIPDDGRLTGAIAVQGGMRWSHPGTVVSGCTTYDMTCTVKIGEAGVRPAEWSWSLFHLSGPGRVFILPPSYAPRCQPELPCLDTQTNAWSYVGIAPSDDEPSITATLEADPPDVEVESLFTVTMKVTNPNTFALTDVQPSAPITIVGEGTAELLTGPTPPSLASLAPGATASFTWEFEATGEGDVALRAKVEGKKPNGDILDAEATCALGTATALAPAGAREGPTCPVNGAARVKIAPKLGVTWEMPDRYFANAAYATTDGVMPAENVNPSGYLLTLFLSEKGKKRETCPPGRVYKWTMKLKDPKPKPKAPKIIIDGHDCMPSIVVDREGEYIVSVEEFISPDEETVVRAARNQTVIVQDWLIVGMGDSNASGQGTAESGSPYHFPQCDRGQYSYQAQVAEMIEANDKRTSVTFLHTACSGARTVHLGSKKYVGQEANFDSLLPPQSKQVLERVKASKIRRQIDAVIVSIGINDLYFGGILGLCIEGKHNQTHLPMCQDLKVRRAKDANKEPTVELDDTGRGPTLDTFIQKIATKKLPSLYKGLGSFSSKLKIPKERIYHVGYPEASTDELGNLCGTTAFPPLGLPDQGVYGPEWEWLRDTGKLLEDQIVARYAGWIPITVGHLFHGHGYCAGGGQGWLQTILGSVSGQGNPYGTFHSRREGHKAMAEEVLPIICQHLDGTNDCKDGEIRVPGK